MPRLGVGMPLSSKSANVAVTLIDDELFLNDVSGEVTTPFTGNRTNKILHSQDLKQSTWTKTNTAIASDLYEAPDNSTTANAINSNNTGERSYTLKQQNLSVTAGKTYTLSVHVKKENLGFAQVRFNDGSVQYKSHFNLTTGAMTNATQIISNSIDAMDDDWFRCSITFQAQNTVSDGDAVVIAQLAAGDSTPNVAVSGIVLLYVWGMQLEEDSRMSAYIVTTNTAVSPAVTLNDTHDIWDFDVDGDGVKTNDITPEADPDAEGVWDVDGNGDLIPLDV